MEFFRKKFCCLCGKKAGLLGRQEIAGGEYLCGDCRVKCSAEITSERYLELTKDEIEAQFELLKKDAQHAQDEFEETSAVIKGTFTTTTIFSVDEKRGAWRAPASLNGFVYGFDQVKDYYLHLDTRYLTQEEREDRRDHGALGMMDFLAGLAHGVSMDRRLPVCPPDEEITKMEVYVVVDHPYADQVCIPVMDAIFVSSSDIRDGYRAAAEIISLLDCGIAAHEESLKGTDGAQHAEMIAIEAIKKYKELLDAGAITKEEFDAKKRQLLNM
ncbi:MAG: SHOCT domain-containing protein [Clostridia bacterium]|nr:SHOCT domain-containing protein [Clostridia bacterium]